METAIQGLGLSAFKAAQPFALDASWLLILSPCDGASGRG